MCQVDVIANSLVLYLPFCSTLNKNFFSSSLLSNVGHFVSGDVAILVSTNFLSLGFESLVSSMQSGQCVQPADLTNWYCFRFEYNRQVVALNMPIHALVVGKSEVDEVVCGSS